jgi:hypothetical protein
MLPLMAPPKHSISLVKTSALSDCASASLPRETQQADLKSKKKKGRKNYSTRDSHVVTHHSTNLAIHCLTRAERTGSRVFSVL